MSSSWYVEFLLRNRLVILSNLVPPDSNLSLYDMKDSLSLEEVDVVDQDPSYIVNLDDDVYNDLLIVEKTVKDLIKENRFSKKEKKILALTLNGKNIVDIERLSGISRITVSKILGNITDRIAFILGGEFTNEGFLEYMKEKYRLSNEQLNTINSFMVSNKRHSFSTGGQKSER